jgi:hypothetical protein
LKLLIKGTFSEKLVDYAISPLLYDAKLDALGNMSPQVLDNNELALNGIVVTFHEASTQAFLIETLSKQLRPDFLANFKMDQSYFEGRALVASILTADIRGCTVF